MKREASQAALISELREAITIVSVLLASNPPHTREARDVLEHVRAALGGLGLSPSQRLSVMLTLRHAIKVTDDRFAASN